MHVKTLLCFALIQATASRKTIIVFLSFTWHSSALHFRQYHTEHTGVRLYHMSFDPLQTLFSDALYNCGPDPLSMLTCSYWNVYCTVMAAFHFCWVFSMLVCQLYQVGCDIEAMTRYCLIKVARSITTNERINAHRYTHFQPHVRRKGTCCENVRSPFSKGSCASNVIEFCWRDTAVQSADWERVLLERRSYNDSNNVV